MAFGAIAPLECPVGLNHFVLRKAGEELERVDVLSVYAAEDSFLRDLKVSDVSNIADKFS